MAKDRYGDLNCDGCSAYFDGDVVEVFATTNLYGVTDPKKVAELTFFWLCGDCAEGYPNGAKDFFVPEYFEDIPMCANCDDEEVEEKGYFCDYCSYLLDDTDTEPRGMSDAEADADALASAGWGTDEDYQ